MSRWREGLRKRSRPIQERKSLMNYINLAKTNIQSSSPSLKTQKLNNSKAINCICILLNSANVCIQEKKLMWIRLCSTTAYMTLTIFIHAQKLKTTALIIVCLLKRRLMQIKQTNIRLIAKFVKKWATFGKCCVIKN